MKYLYLLPLALLTLVACDKKEEEPESTAVISAEEFVGTWAYTEGGELVYKTFRGGNDTTLANTAAVSEEVFKRKPGTVTMGADGTFKSTDTAITENGDSVIVNTGTYVLAGDTMTITTPEGEEYFYLFTKYEDGVLSFETIGEQDLDGDGEADDKETGMVRKVDAAASEPASEPATEEPAHE